MNSLPVNLVRAQDNQVVGATLAILDQRHVDEFEASWKASLRQFSQEDKYWDWAFKQRTATKYDNYECYVVEYAGRTQGLMMIETQWHRSQLAPGQPLVYIASLSVAPWNRRMGQKSPQFKRVGSALLSFSRVRSVALGYRGRMGLHALPGAEGFYEYQNMMRFDLEADDFVDDDEPPLAYFEYPPLKEM